MSSKVAHVTIPTQGINVNVITNDCRSTDVLYEPHDPLLSFLLISCWKKLADQYKKACYRKGDKTAQE
jgi:hypothetical protein